MDRIFSCLLLFCIIISRGRIFAYFSEWPKCGKALEVSLVTFAPYHQVRPKWDVAHFKEEDTTPHHHHPKKYPPHSYEGGK